jgi:hypothetical protein
MFAETTGVRAGDNVNRLGDSGGLNDSKQTEGADIVPSVQDGPFALSEQRCVSEIAEPVRVGLENEHSWIEYTRCDPANRMLFGQTLSTNRICCTNTVAELVDEKRDPTELLMTFPYSTTMML